MRVFVLTETENTDPKWCYNETFNDIEMARERMRSLYHELIVENHEAVKNAEVTQNSAYGEFDDGKIIAWNIKDCDVQ